MRVMERGGGNNDTDDGDDGWEGEPIRCEFSGQVYGQLVLGVVSGVCPHVGTAIILFAHPVEHPNRPLLRLPSIVCSSETS
jgi:hypothetical protein